MTQTCPNCHKAYETTLKGPRDERLIQDQYPHAPPSNVSS